MQTNTTVSINKVYDQVEIRKLLFIDGMAYITLGYYTIENDIEVKAPSDLNIEKSFDISEMISSLSVEEKATFDAFVALVINKTQQ